LQAVVRELRLTAADRRALCRLFDQLHVQRPDGTTATALVEETEATESWTGSSDFENALEALLKRRLVRRNRLRIEETSATYLSLGHDRLVEPLVDWSRRERHATRQGRAELQLAERAALWIAKPENRHLPSLWEWINIRALTDKKKWIGPHSKMMGKATRVHGSRMALAAIIIVILSFAGINLNNANESRRLVESLRNADISNVSTIINELAGYRTWADAKLTTEFAESEDDSAKLHAGLALLAKDDSTFDYVRERLLNVTPVQFPYVRDILQAHQEVLVEPYWKIATDAQEDPPRRFQAACALATFDAGHENWREEGFAWFLATHLVNVRPSELAP
jgi:hypothetical protein